MPIRSVALEEDAAQDATIVRVRLADDRGWVLRVERAGRVVSSEAFTDWHHLERRRALLEGDGGGQLPLAPARANPPERARLPIALSCSLHDWKR